MRFRSPPQRGARYILVQPLLLLTVIFLDVNRWSRGGSRGVPGRWYWLPLWMVTWGAGARRIGRCSGWSRRQVTGFLLHDRLAYVILVDEFIVGRFRSFKGHSSRRRHRGGRLCYSLLHCGHISVILRKVEAD